VVLPAEVTHSLVLLFLSIKGTDLIQKLRHFFLFGDNITASLIIQKKSSNLYMYCFFPFPFPFLPASLSLLSLSLTLALSHYCKISPLNSNLGFPFSVICYGVFLTPSSVVSSSGCGWISSFCLLGIRGNLQFFTHQTWEVSRFGFIEDLGFFSFP